MRLLILLLLIAFQHCHGQEDKINNSQTNIIYQYIKDSLPNYKFIVESEKNIKSLYFQKYKEQTLSCVSDFNGDNVDDYAILLSDTNNRVCLFVFNIANNVVKHFLIDCFGIWEGEIDEFKIKIKPKGEWEAIDEIIKVPFDGIIVDDLKESLSKAYYWNGDEFVKFLFD